MSAPGRRALPSWHDGWDWLLASACAPCRPGCPALWPCRTGRCSCRGPACRGSLQSRVARCMVQPMVTTTGPWRELAPRHTYCADHPCLGRRVSTIPCTLHSPESLSAAGLSGKPEEACSHPGRTHPRWRHVRWRSGRPPRGPGRSGWRSRPLQEGREEAGSAGLSSHCLVINIPPAVHCCSLLFIDT